MILAVCADKGAPGVTTAAVALSLVWPSERVLLEADPSGGDLALRLRDPSGGVLAVDRGVTALAADARDGIPAGALTQYAQPTSLGFPVLAGPMSAEGFEPIARLWPQVAAAAHGWPGTVIADLGRLQVGHASSPLAATATTVLLLTRADTSEALFHTRQRAHELAARLERGSLGRSPLVVAVVTSPRGVRQREAALQRALAAQATTSTIPVLGVLVEDSRAVDGLRSGQLTKRLLSCDLLSSAKSLAQALLGWFPELAGTPDLPAGSAPTPLRQPVTPVGQHLAQSKTAPTRATGGAS